MHITPSLMALAKTGVGKAIGHLTPEARRLVAQRRAAAGDEVHPHGLLAAEVDAVIAVLTGQAENPGLLRDWMAKIKQSITGVDDLFRGDSLKAWFDDPRVRSALGVVASGRLMGENPTQREEEANSILAAAYERHLGDRGEFARGAIEVVVAVLTAGLYAVLSADPAAGALAVLILAGYALSGEKLDRIEGAVNSITSALLNGDLVRPPSVLPDDKARGTPSPPHPAVDIEAVSRAFGAASQAVLSWPQEIDGHWIERPELEHLHTLAVSDTPGVTVLLGGPGEGKSALLARLGTRLADEGVLLLAIKADQMPRHVGTLEALDEWIGAKTSVTSAFRKLASAQRVVLLVDQLDALADLMDLHGERLTALLRLVHEVMNIPNLQVILTCREFEFRNDVRLNTLRAEPVTLSPLSWQHVLPLLNASGSNPAGWDEEVQDVLRTPQHLAIFLAHLADTGTAPTFGSYQAMLEEVITSRIERKFGPRTLEAAERIAIAMADAEDLRVGRARFAREFGAEIGHLEAEGFLVASNDRLSLVFRHQTLFDFIRTRAFLREGTSLAAYVTEGKQESLFVRPILWSALQYLRAADRALYRREFGALWSREALRPHLRFLLVAFLGQVNDPDDIEARWLLPTLDALSDRPRTLRAMASGRGWLARIHGRLPELMRAPPREAWSVIPLLRSAVTRERDAVLGLVERFWASDSQYVGHALEVVQNVQEWDERASNLACRLASDLSVMTAHCRHLTTIIAQTRPDLAVAVVVSRLRAELARAKAAPGPDQESSGHGSIDGLLARAHEWHELDKLVARAPREFLEAAWPWLLSSLEASAAQDGEYVDGTYRPAKGLAWVRLKGKLRADIPSAFDSAMRAFAETDPGAYVVFVEARQASDLMVVHRLIAAGMERLVAARPEAALDYLLGDPRRFALGEYHDVIADTGRIVAALVPALGDDDALRLERAIVSWPGLRAQEPGALAELRRRRRDAVRKLRLRLLRLFPAERLSQAGRRHREQEERAFPWAPNFDVGEPVSYYVGGSMSAAQMAAASGDAILNLFGTLTDDTEWDHPRRRRLDSKGGSIPTSREFAVFAKAHPDRALCLIGRFRPGCQERPVGTALATLGEVKEVDPGQLVACVHRLEAAGFSSSAYRADAAHCLREVARRADGLDDATCALLEGWLEDWVAPDATAGSADEVLQAAPTEDGERASSILWDRSGIEIWPEGNFSTLDAITLGYLLREPPDVDGWLGVLDRHLTRPENPRVWIGLVRFLDYLYLAQRERAIAWLGRLLQRFPEILRSRAGVHVVFHVLDFIPPDLYAWVNRSWLTSGWVEGPQAAGEISALRFCRRVEDPDSRAELAGLIEGSGIALALVPGVRLGIAYTLVEAWPEPMLRAYVTPLLLRLIQEADEATSGALRTLFLRTDPLPADRWTDQVLGAFVSHSHVLGKGDGTFVLDRLKDVITGGGDARLVHEVISTLMDHAASQLKDVRTSWAGQIGELVELALTLHRMPETRLEGLALFERLIALEVYGVEDRLASLDRRLLR